MKPQKIENITELLAFIDEYYDTRRQDIVFKAVGGFLNTKIIIFEDEPKESFRTKVESFYNYCLTSEYIPPFLIRNPDDEFEIGQLFEKYY